MGQLGEDMFEDDDADVEVGDDDDDFDEDGDDDGAGEEAKLASVEDIGEQGVALLKDRLKEQGVKLLTNWRGKRFAALETKINTLLGNFPKYKHHERGQPVSLPL